jgi:hypothetical protein
LVSLRSSHSLAGKIVSEPEEHGQMSQPRDERDPAEHDVLTTDNVTSYESNIKQADKVLKAMEAKAANNAQLAKVHTELTAARAKLLERVESLRKQINKPLKSVRGMKELVADTKTYLKTVSDASKKDYRTVYKFGTKKITSDSAMKAAIKGEGKLPATAEKYVPQAVNDLWAGRGKSTPTMGAGVLHASAGKAAVKDNSCTIFFTRTLAEGKETVTVLAVGSHVTNNSYTIYLAPVRHPKLVEGKVVKI